VGGDCWSSVLILFLGDIWGGGSADISDNLGDGPDGVPAGLGGVATGFVFWEEEEAEILVVVDSWGVIWLHWGDLSSSSSSSSDPDSEPDSEPDSDPDSDADPDFGVGHGSKILDFFPSFSSINLGGIKSTSLHQKETKDVLHDGKFLTVSSLISVILVNLERFWRRSSLEAVKGTPEILHLLPLSFGGVFNSGHAVRGMILESILIDPWVASRIF